MKENCIDIGSIQAFLDSELSHDQTDRVSTHIALCDDCAFMLAEAEEESAVVFPALERELNSLVPSQRLWNKINDSLEIERESRPFWQKAWAFLAIALANPSMAAAASLLIVVGVVSALLMSGTTAPVEVGSVNKPSASKQALEIDRPAQPVQAVTTTVQSQLPQIDETNEPQPVPKIERAVYRPESRTTRVESTTARKPVSTSEPSSGFLPGEESYVKTIASLKNSVDDQKDTVLRPSERISYERDMAVVNDTISKMKVEVKKNPRNESAKQVLYSSYQNKIDLLNSVAQKEELVASLQR